MAGDDEDDPHWARQLLVGLGVMVVVAVVIGAVASVVALGAAKVSGLGGSGGATSEARPSLYLPGGRPTTRLDPYPAPSGASASGPARPRPTPRPSATAKPPALTLEASPARVGSGERITLSGAYRGGGGATLQVQRFDGGSWTDFPVTVNVTGGRYSTYITTSRTGVNRLRVLDEATGKASTPVRVTVG